MTLRRALSVGLLGLLLAAAPAAAVSAAPGDYPPDGDVSISLSASVITVGGSVTVTGSGFRPGSTVEVGSTRTAQGFAPAGVSGFAAPLAAPLAAPRSERLAAVAVTAGAAGTFSTSLTFSEVGTFVVTASGTSATGAAASASATLQVVAAGGIGGGGDTGGGSGSGSGGGASGVGGSLPNTGASLVLPLTVGGLLLLTGVGLVVAARRRRHGGVSI